MEGVCETGIRMFAAGLFQQSGNRNHSITQSAGSCVWVLLKWPTLDPVELLVLALHIQGCPHAPHIRKAVEHTPGSCNRKHQCPIFESQAMRHVPQSFPSPQPGRDMGFIAGLADFKDGFVLPRQAKGGSSEILTT